MTFRRLKLLFLSMLAVLPLAGCGSGDDDDEEIARIVDLFFENSTIERGAPEELLVDFSFAAEAIGDEDRNVIIKLVIPDGLAYEPESAEVDGRIDDNDVDPERIERCGDGSTVLTFDLDENDLFDADDPAGDADGTLKLNIVGLESGSYTLSGKANYDILPGSCDDSFVPDSAVVLFVTP